MRIVLSVIFSLAAAAGPTAAAGAQARVPDSPLKLLDVPYIQQSEALCGGAAAAMVMRFWGATAVNAEAFAALVDVAAGGIRGEDLLLDLRSRGWDAQSFRGDRTVVTDRLAESQPVVVLIEDRPGSFHFVVIVGWANGRVVYHDPARSPFRVAGETDFEAAWQKSDRWTLLLLPPAAGIPGKPDDNDPAVAEPSTTRPCDDLVAEGVRLAERGDRTAAREVFMAAGTLCPTASGPLREAAGISAVEGDWTAAERLARDAVSRDASDAHAWRIIATSAYLRDDAGAALDAWNQLGEPLIDLVSVAGLSRTRHAIATGLIGLAAGEVLTAKSLAAAAQRLRDLPSAEFARVFYRPLGGGRAAVEAVVVERPALPTTRASLTTAVLRLLTDREVVAAFASPTGNGELFQGSWRWWENRPRIEIAFAAPTRVGVWRLSAFGEEQAYGGPEDAGVERRRGAGITWSRWTSTMTRLSIGAGLDRWNGDDRTISLTASVDQRWYSDRLSVRLDGSVFGGDFATRSAGLAAAWRSRSRSEGLVLLGGGGWSGVTSDAPRALWAGAGTGQGRDPLLRAHPLLEDGRIVGEVFGRSLLHGSAEMRWWLAPVFKVVRIAPAAFVDLARAEQRLQPGSAWHADAGFGVRIAVPAAGTLRVDLGRGLRDGTTAFSFAWTR